MKSQDEIEEQVARFVEDASLGKVPASAVSQDRELIADLGLDSLDYATVLLGCERWMGIKVNEAGVDWSQVRTVGQLASFLHGQQRA